MRRAILGLVLVAGVFLLGRVWLRAPVDVTVSYRLGELARDVREVRIRYDRADDAGSAREVLFRYGTDGAPAELVHRTRLAPGNYQVELELVSATREQRKFSRRFELHGSGEHVTLDIG